MTRDPPHRLRTGISGLDEITRGGLPAGRWYLVRGGPGTGKTTLGLHFLAEGAHAGATTLLIALDKPTDAIRVDAESLGFDLDGVEFLDLSPGPEFFTEEATYDLFSPSEVERSPLTRKIVDAVERTQPDRIVVDALTMFRYFMRDPLQLRTEVMSLMRFLTERGATVLGGSEIDPTAPDADLQFLSSGVVTLRSMSLQRRGFRTLAVEKLLGSDYVSGAHAMSLTDTGMEVYPRLVPAVHGKEFRPDQLSSGTPELDDILHGGLERGTTTLVAGPTGTGKSTLAAQFVAQAAAAGERAVIYAFEEDRATILRRCEALGIPAAELLDRGVLSIVEVPALQITADEFAARVRHEVERENARFVVIDSLAGYQLTLLGPELIDQLYALSKYFRNMGVTAILTREVERILGEFRLTEVGISYMADNIIFLRYLELRGGLRKAIGVLKKRISSFDPTLREIEFTPDGLRVGPALTGLRGILLGTPELSAVQAPDRENGAPPEEG